MGWTGGQAENTMPPVKAFAGEDALKASQQCANSLLQLSFCLSTNQRRLPTLDNSLSKETCVILSNINLIGDTVHPPMATSYPLAQKHTVLSRWGEALMAVLFQTHHHKTVALNTRTGNLVT